MDKAKNPEIGTELDESLISSESAEACDAQSAEDEQFPELDDATDVEQPEEQDEAVSDEHSVEQAEADGGKQPPEQKKTRAKRSKKTAPKEEQSLEGQMLETTDSTPVITEGGDVEQNSAKMAAAARKYNNNRSLMRDDAQRRAEERQQRQDTNEKSLMAWSSLTNAMKNRLIVQVLITSVRILDDRKTVIASGMVDGYRIVIPYVHMFINPAAVNDDDTNDMHRARRQQRMLQKMIGCTVPVIITQMSRAADGDYGILGSRVDALMQLRRLNFESNPPRVQEGSSVMADVIAVAEHAVRVSVCGFDGSIPIRKLSPRYIQNATEHYTTGQKLRVIIRNIKYDKSGHVASIAPSSIDAEIEDLHDNIYSLAVYDNCVGTITRIPDPPEDKPDVVHPWLFLDHYNVPARAMRIRTDSMATPLKTGDKVMFMVTRLDKERGLAIGDIVRRYT